MHKILCATFCGKPVESVESVENSKFRLPRANRAECPKLLTQPWPFCAVVKNDGSDIMGYKGGEKMALISVKEVKNAIQLMVQILEKLDMIYHALHDNK